jgi:cytochrome c556
MTKTFQFSLGISAIALAAALIAPSVSAFANPAPDDDKKEEHAEKSEKKALWEIEDIMETTHKGKVSVVKKVIAGEATDAEIKLLLEQYLTLERLTPPQGELDLWKTKTAALTKATAGIVAGVEGSRKALEEAVNCKACHKTYKPD